MDKINLTESFTEFKEFKDIDRPTMMNILESVFRNMIIKKYGSDENFDIILNIDKGDLEVWRNREIVEDGEVEDENSQIALSEAIKIEPDFEVGEEASEEVKLNDFGRRAVLALRQNLISKVLELEKDNIFKKYEDRVGEIINGEVYQVWKRELLIIDDEAQEAYYATRIGATAQVKKLSLAGRIYFTIRVHVHTIGGSKAPPISSS